MMDADRAVLMELVLARVRVYQEARKRDAMIEDRAKSLEAEMAAAPAPFRMLWQAARALDGDYAAQWVKAPDWDGYPKRVEQLCRGPE